MGESPANLCGENIYSAQSNTVDNSRNCSKCCFILKIQQIIQKITTCQFRITLRTSTLSDSSTESMLCWSGSSSRPTGVTREGLPKPGGSNGFTTATKNVFLS